MPDSGKLCLILPTLSFLNICFGKILRLAGFKVYYRGTYDEELHRLSYEHWLQSTRRFRFFLDTAIRSHSVKKVAALFSLDPDALLIRGRQLILQRFQKDFHFSSLASSVNRHGKAAVIFPTSKRLRIELDGLLETNSTSLGIRAVSTTGFIIDRLTLGFKTSLRAMCLILLLIYWRLSGPSKRVEEIRGSLLWQADGPGEISLSPGKLSLPLYLKEVWETLGFEDVRFSVICSFLGRKKGWAKPYSQSFPPLRYISPGLSTPLLFQELKDLFKLLINLPAAVLQGDEKVDLLSLLPHLFLKRAWFSSVPVKAVIVTNACAGADHAMAHGARQIGIPVIMVFYSENIHPALTEASYYDVVQNEFQEMLSNHFCVWTVGMKKWLEKIGYRRENIHVVGPQMFAPIIQRKDRDLEKAEKIKVAVIEVTPLNKEELVKRGFGKGFYTRENCLLFLTEAIDAIRRALGEEGSVILKMKRRVDFTRFDRSWFQERRSYIQQFNGFIAEQEPDTNPWILIDEADVILSIPFSSMSEAGWAMGKPSAFFDPTLRILPRLDDDVPLLSGSQELYYWLRGIRMSREYVLRKSRQMKMGPPMVAHALEQILFMPNRSGING